MELARAIDAAEITVGDGFQEDVVVAPLVNTTAVNEVNKLVHDCICNEIFGQLRRGGLGR